jgi:hypothetical protein
MKSHRKIMPIVIVLVAVAAVSIYFFSDDQQATADLVPDLAQTQVATAEPPVTALETKTPSFYEEADARREQRQIEQEEADRVAKLKAAKENSLDCKFWKQQAKNSSNSEKIAQKIDEFCVYYPKSNSTSSEGTIEKSPDNNQTHNTPNLDHKSP